MTSTSPIRHTKGFLWKTLLTGSGGFRLRLWPMAAKSITHLRRSFAITFMLRKRALTINVLWMDRYNIVTTNHDGSRITIDRKPERPFPQDLKSVTHAPTPTTPPSRTN